MNHRQTFFPDSSRQCLNKSSVLLGNGLSPLSFFLTRHKKSLQKEVRAFCLVFRSLLLLSSFSFDRLRQAPARAWGRLTGLWLCVRAEQPNGEISPRLCH